MLFLMIALGTAAASRPVASRARRAPATANLEYQVKAAFIFNFANFTTWPGRAFASASSPLEICIVGSDPFDGDLERTVAGEHVGQHPLAVEHRARPGDIKGCDIAFLPAGSGKDAQLARAELDAPILTIGETEQFWDDGGIITFRLDNGHVRFDINDTMAKRRGLQLSSRLLRVARRVK